MKVDNFISEDQAALYDRQIRLWGVDAQKRLLNSRVLLININGLGCEVAKNLVLSGIHSITLHDSHKIDENDLITNFLLDKSSIGLNRGQLCIENLQILNPTVKINAVDETIDNIDEVYLNNFDLVCALEYNNTDQIIRINELCRKNNILFICGSVHGIHGHMFVDLNNFKFIHEVRKVIEDDKNCNKNSKKTEEHKLELEEKTKYYAAYSKFLNSYEDLIKSLSEKKLKRLSKTYFALLLLRLFNEKHKAQLNHSNKHLFIELKNEFLQNNKLDSTLIDDLFAEQLIGDSSSVNAILGGIISQEVIKAISKKNEPTDNLFLFDGYNMSGVVEAIGY